ncbi:MAG: hypothetical protein Kow0077_25230 [Anaerolineae bacterium]
MEGLCMGLVVMLVVGAYLAQVISGKKPRMSGDGFDEWRDLDEEDQEALIVEFFDDWDEQGW